jgi:stage III sporulation protein AA
MQSLLQLFSVSLRQRLAALPSQIVQDLQEIRVREQRPLEIGWGRQYSFVSQTGGLTNDPAEAYRPNREDCAALLEMLTQHSLYTFEEELRRGFITVAGGHRIGLAGRTVLEQGKVRLLKDISSFNIRVAKEHKGCGDQILPYVTDSTGQGSILHTLIVSPPQQGKTTLIRDLARIISRGPVTGSGSALRRGYKVGIVDERSEIAACIRGVPRFELGPRTDVLDGCPKAEGMMMMIRSMSPELLIVDEIGRPEDAAAIHEAIHAGIAVMATAHGLNYDDISRRPVLKELLHDQVFKRIVVLSNQSSVGALEGIYDGQGRRLNTSTKGSHALTVAVDQERTMTTRSGQPSGITLC